MPWGKRGGIGMETPLDFHGSTTFRYWFNEKATNSEPCFRCYGILLGQARVEEDEFRHALGMYEMLVFTKFWLTTLPETNSKSP